ncbi:MAG: zf-HC2 domain-containing protein [Thiobacillus sp.]|nr:zf-HC2 domain-containing protein [Thiobacillus sp.]
MLTCQGASHLVSESQDRTLGLFESLGLRMHVWMCINCRRFETQIRQMRRLLRQSSLHDTTGAAHPLSTKAHQRISKVISGR